jgi:hypothetical protein
MIDHLLLRSMLLLALVSIPTTATSQRMDQVQDGARVRLVPYKGKATIGTAMLIASDSIDIKYPESGQARRFALRDLAGVEVSAGVSHVKGAFIYGVMGLAIGAAVGAAIGATTPTNDSFVLRRSERAQIGGMFMGLVGGLAGIVGGASKGWEDWMKVQ